MGRVVKTGKSILCADVRKDNDYIGNNPNTRSELAVPIVSGEKVIGVINAEHSDCDAFDEADQQSLEALATYVAIAIENARHVKEIEQRALQMQTASRVARHATSILEIEQLLDQTVNLISDRFHLYHTAIFLIEKEYAVLKAASSEGGKKMLQEEHKLKIGKEGIVGHVAKSGEARIVSDVNQDKDFLRNPHLLATCSEIALPLQVHNQIIGALDVQFCESNTFFEEAAIPLQMMADQLAVAIQNARQYDELRQTKGLVGASTALAWMGMASSTWRHTIDKHARTIAEQIDLLRGELIQLNMSDNYPDLDRRLSLIWRLARQIEEKPITPPLSSEEGVASVQVNVLIRERTGRLWESDPYKSFALKLYLVLSDKFTIRASPEWLRRAIDILIDNAVGAMADSSCREITIKTGQKDKWVEILISDTGKGIPPEVLPKIFVKPIEKAEGAKGLGMGLLMAQVIIQTYGGEIGVASTDSGGTAMFIRLPLEP
jgi:GAF domain-containing protein